MLFHPDMENAARDSIDRGVDDRAIIRAKVHSPSRILLEGTLKMMSVLSVRRAAGAWILKEETP
jgi:hypothetical protein